MIVLLCVNQVHDMTTLTHKHRHGIVLMEPSTWSSGPLRLTHFCSVTVPAGVWAVQRMTGESPPPLSFPTFTKIDHHRAVVFGGYRYVQGDIYLNGTYVLDMETWVWKCMCLYILLCTYCLAAGDQGWKHYYT